MINWNYLQAADTLLKACNIKMFSNLVSLLLQLGCVWTQQLQGAPITAGTNWNHQLAEV